MITSCGTGTPCLIWPTFVICASCVFSHSLLGFPLASLLTLMRAYITGSEDELLFKPGKELAHAQTRLPCKAGRVMSFLQAYSPRHHLPLQRVWSHAQSSHLQVRDDLAKHRVVVI